MTLLENDESTPNPMRTFPEYNGQHVTYAYDALHDIHRVVFLDASREAVEEWIQVMDAIYNRLTPQDAVRILFDERSSGSLPLTYSINRGIHWARALEYHHDARVAFLFPDRMIASLANSMLSVVQRQIGHLNIRLFDPTKEAEAIAWLTDPNWPKSK